MRTAVHARILPYSDFSRWQSATWLFSLSPLVKLGRSSLGLFLLVAKLHDSSVIGPAQSVHPFAPFDIGWYSNAPDEREARLRQRRRPFSLNVCSWND